MKYFKFIVDTPDDKGVSYTVSAPDLYGAFIDLTRSISSKFEIVRVYEILNIYSDDGLSDPLELPSANNLAEARRQLEAGSSPGLRTRYGPVVRSHSGLSQFPEEVTPDLGFSTASIARRKARHEEQTRGPMVYHEQPAPTPAPPPVSPPTPEPPTEPTPSDG